VKSGVVVLLLLLWAIYSGSLTFVAAVLIGGILVKMDEKQT